MEILVTIIIISTAVYIFVKNIKKKGCSCDSSSCSKCTSACSQSKKR